MKKKKHISELLKKGARLKTKLTKEDLVLIDKTVEAQKNIPQSYRFPYWD